MSTSAPIKKEYDIPMIRPRKVEDEGPKKLTPGTAVPVTPYIVVPAKEPVRIRR